MLLVLITLVYHNAQFKKHKTKLCSFWTHFVYSVHHLKQYGIVIYAFGSRLCRLCGRWVSQKANLCLETLSLYTHPVCTVTYEYFQSSFFGLLPTLVDVSVGTLGGTRNIHLIFDICPCFVKNVVGYCSHSVPYVRFQLLKIVVFDPVDDVLHIILQK